MISLIKKHRKKAYLFLALSYSIILPIVLMLNYKFKFHDNVFKLFPNLISVIAIITIIIFLIDCIINKTNIIKFIKNNKSCIFFCLSFIFLSIASLNSKNTQLSIFGTDYRFGGILSYLFYIFLAILGYKLTEKHRKIFFRSTIYVTTIISILSLINSNITQQFFFSEYSGIFFNINHFATFLVYTIIITIFTFYNDKNIFLSILDYICFVILIIMLIVNNTFGCYLAILFILIINIIFIIKNKLYIKYLLLILSFIILSITIKIDGNWYLKDNFESLLIDLNIIKGYTENYSNFNEEENKNYVDSFIIYMGSYRGELWYYTIDLIKKKPLIGYGLESLNNEYKNYSMQSGNDMPHNLILHLWVCGGIFTLLFYLIGNILILIKNRKSFYENNCLTIIYFIILGHLFQSMFNNTLFYVTSIYAIFFGMIYNNLKQKKDNN